jgi:serine/threonine protein kinase
LSRRDYVPLKTCPKCYFDNSDESRFCQKCGTGLSEVGSDQKDPLVGKTLAGNFLIQKKLAVGGMGSIYLAEQVSLAKRVCIKVLHKHLLRDTTLIKRFHREARAASKLKHPNCINVIDFGQADNGVLYLAMDFVEGVDLATLLEREHPLGPERVIHIMGQVAMALDEAHSHGIIHRDLKPENIMIEQRRHQPDFVCVLDFGIAKIKEPGREDKKETFETMAGVVCGTPEYMSPEQIRGEELDARTDIYSFGVIMWQLFTRRLPFNGATAIAIVTRHLTEAPEPPTRYAHDLPPSVEAFILKMMSKNKADRPRNAMEVKERLDELLAEIKRPKAPAPVVDERAPMDSRGPSAGDMDATLLGMSLPEEFDAVGKPGTARAGDSEELALDLAPTVNASRQEVLRAAQAAQVAQVVRHEGGAAAQRQAPAPAQPGARPAPGSPRLVPVAGPAGPAAPIRDQLQSVAAALPSRQREPSNLTPLADLAEGDAPTGFRAYGVWVALAVLALGAVAAGVVLLPRLKAAWSGSAGDAEVQPLAGGASATQLGASATAAEVQALEEAPEVVAASPGDGEEATAEAQGGAAPESPPGEARPGDSAREAGRYESMGDLAFRSGNYSEAKVYYKLSQKYDDNPALNKKIGYCYKNQGDLASARDAFRKYLQSLPSARRQREEIELSPWLK